MPTDSPDRSHDPHRWRAARPARPRRALLGAVGAAVVAGVLIAYAMRAERTLPAPSPTSSQATTPSPPTPMPPPVLAAAEAPAPATGSGPTAPWLKPANNQTPTVSLAELQELRESLATASDRDDEFTRLTEQMLLADATRRFLQLRGSPGANLEELHGLVELIGPVLDAQFKRGELSRADAIELKSKLLQVHYPQAAMQQGELARWLAVQTGR